MKLSVGILVLFAMGCISLTDGCQHGVHRRKRSLTAPEVDEKLASFFQGCLSGPASGIFVSLRSVIDTVIRDTEWYKDVKAGVCSHGQDVAECWIYALPFLLEIDSSLYEPTAKCICEWAKTCWVPPSGITKRSVFSQQTYITTNTYGSRPTPLSSEQTQFSSCTNDNTKKFTRQYPSLNRFDGRSNSIFFRDHYTYCRDIPKFPYQQRNLFVLLYIKRVCPKTGPKSTWRKDVVTVYREATRKDGPLSRAVDTCDPNIKPDPCNPNPCRNGKCIQTFGNNYRCYCIMGYTGKHCENGPCQSNPCKNGGNCVARSGGYTCYCRTGYFGRNCEKTNACNPNPCNNGQCILHGGSYNCFCSFGYTGKHCENGPCQRNPCQNGGNCVARSGGYICYCRTGYSGRNCERGSDVCNPNPCTNGQSCIKSGFGYRCVCPFVFPGDRCQKANAGSSNGGELCKDDLSYCSRLPGYVCSNPVFSTNCKKTCNGCI